MQAISLTIFALLLVSYISAQRPPLATNFNTFIDRSFGNTLFVNVESDGSFTGGTPALLYFTRTVPDRNTNPQAYDRQFAFMIMPAPCSQYYRVAYANDPQYVVEEQNGRFAYALNKLDVKSNLQLFKINSVGNGFFTIQNKETEHYWSNALNSANKWALMASPYLNSGVHFSITAQ